MINFFSIAKKNRDTFYNYSSNEKDPIWPMVLVQIIVALFLSILFPNVGKDFLRALLAVYSILIGFSFNVLFHLASSDKWVVSTRLPEDELKIERMNTLRQELFHNVCYFVSMSVFLTIFSLAYFVVDGGNIKILYSVKSLVTGDGRAETLFNMAGIALLFFLLWIFYFLLIDTIYTFLRIINRINFFFEEKVNSDQG